MVCKRELDPEKEEIHIAPKEEGGHDTYCGHCWSELRRWLGQYGVDMEKDGQ